MKKCFRCNYKWLNIIKNPFYCPNCNSKNYNYKGFLKCEICKRKFFKIHIHHIDGNIKNNINKNLIRLCEDCHSVIHNGYKIIKVNSTGNNEKSRIREYKDKFMLKKLNNLRKKWLKNKERRDSTLLH